MQKERANAPAPQRGHQTAKTPQGRRVCTASCLRAKRPKCRCICNARNHGINPQATFGRAKPVPRVKAGKAKPAPRRTAKAGDNPFQPLLISLGQPPNEWASGQKSAAN